MNRIVRNLVLLIISDGRLRTRLYRGGLALLAALCLLILPTGAKAACGSFGAAGLKSGDQTAHGCAGRCWLPLTL